MAESFATRACASCSEFEAAVTRNGHRARSAFTSFSAMPLTETYRSADPKAAHAGADRVPAGDQAHRDQNCGCDPNTCHVVRHGNSIPARLLPLAS